MEINKIQDKIIDQFDALTRQTNKFKYFRYLAHLGEELPGISHPEKTEDTLIQGNKSHIWLQAYYAEGKVYYTGDSDRPITRGMLSLLLRVFSGQAPKDIVNSDLYFPNEIHLYRYISREWLNDMMATLQKIRLYAVSCQLESA
jgi:cysteine desulfuration protein SufE